MNIALAFTVRDIIPYDHRLEEFIISIKKLFPNISIIATSSDANARSQQRMQEIANRYKFDSYEYFGDLKASIQCTI